VSLVYFGISFFWILFSDRLILGEYSVLSSSQKETASMIKGWLFVVTSAILIFILIKRELSRRQTLEREMVESERRFRAVFDNAGLGIVLVTPAGKLLDVNPAAAAMVGYSREEMRGMSMFALTYVDDVAKEEASFRRAIKSGQPVSFHSEKRYVRKDGSIFYGSLTASFVRDRAGHLLYEVGVIEDVTKAREVDQAKTDFVTFASHQLRTPLTIVSWYAEAIMSGSAGTLNDKQLHYFTHINEANSRMIQLVSDLLNTSRIDTGRFVVNMETTNAATIVGQVLETLRPRIENHLIHIDKSYGGDIEHLLVDHQLLTIVLQNLLGNAVKYSRPSGRVRLVLVATADELNIEVGDHGYGIPEDYHDQMFKKFSRADNIREVEPDGTGLGLYMTKALIDQVHGNIWYESTEGKGTTFHVVLPFNNK
jgi:PAS domain S-box-containing protein